MAKVELRICGPTLHRWNNGALIVWWRTSVVCGGPLRTAACPYYSNDSAITGLRIGTEEYTRPVSDASFETGIYAPAMTYPVVAHGEARLRFQVSTAHTAGDLDQAAQTISRCIGQTSS
jgi:7-keto-8-aminopelargonate synthetase-like enzyme